MRTPRKRYKWSKQHVQLDTLNRRLRIVPPQIFETFVGIHTKMGPESALLLSNHNHVFFQHYYICVTYLLFHKNEVTKCDERDTKPRSRAIYSRNQGFGTSQEHARQQPGKQNRNKLYHKCMYHVFRLQNIEAYIFIEIKKSYLWTLLKMQLRY